METRAIFFCCVVISGLYALSAEAIGGGGEFFEPMNQSCATERATYCKSAMPSDARIALCLYSHEQKLSAQCAVSVYDAIAALHTTLRTISDYAKTCRSDLMKFCATTKWGEGRLYDCLTENSNSLTLECRIALNGARPELRKLGIVK